jgi:hypothetical protein
MATEGNARELHLEQIDRVSRGILEAPGVTEPQDRLAAFEGTTVPEPIRSYLAKVRTQAWMIVDQDFEALRAAGHREDAILELTVAAALGEAARRHEAALRAVFGEP